MSYAVPGANGTASLKVCHEQPHAVAIGEMGEKSHDQSHAKTRDTDGSERRPTENRDEAAREAWARPVISHTGSYELKQSPAFLSHRDGEESPPDSSQYLHLSVLSL